MPDFKSFTLFWLKIGFISFGGPAGQIALLHKEVVENKKWLTEERFLHALNYCFFLPGPEAQQLATYIGWSLFGIRGGLVSGLLFILPSFFILVAISSAVVFYHEMPLIQRVTYGISICVVALVLEAFIRLCRKSLKTNGLRLIALGSFVGLTFLRIPYPYLITLAALFGYLIESHKSQSISCEAKIERAKLNGTYFLKRAFFILIIFSAIWCIPLFILYLLDMPPFFRSLSFFFTKLAFITFGGAYAVLPYMAEWAVTHFGWLSSSQMITGLGLAESTPGPLIMVVTYVGYIAGFKMMLGSGWAAFLGAALATFYTFLPSFFFIFSGAPLIDWISQKRVVKSFLTGIAAAVVGVVFTLALKFGTVVLFPESNLMKPDWLAFGVASGSFYLLQWKQWSIVSVLFLSTAFVSLISLAF